MQTPTPTPTPTLRNLIGGSWAPSSSGATLDVWDPSTAEVLAAVPLSGPEDVDRAVARAAEAAARWRDEPVPRRARLMFRLHTLIERHAEELARLIVLENGKGIEEARGEIQRGLEVVEFAAGAPTLLMGEGLEQVATGVDTDLYRHPLGVAVGITPFNFPAMIPLWMAPLAIVCGNAFILKPSQRTPQTAGRLAELFLEAGTPDGVVSVVHGAGETAELLIEHPGVAAVSVVGSAAIARRVYAMAAAAGKRVQALAGAKNHIVVMPDADLDLAAEAILSSAFSNGGQRCLAASVAVVIDEVADALVERIARLAGAAPIGSGLDPENVVTPLTTEEHRGRVAAWIETGLGEGARMVLDGRGRGPSRGFFLGPTILDDVQPEMSVAQEEIFGPVLLVHRVPTLERAIAAVNGSRYGNAAAIFTPDGGAARRFRREADAGMIGVNIGVPAPMAFFPFAGWKGSFFGDLHATGKDAINFYTERKVIVSRWPDRPEAGP